MVRKEKLDAKAWMKTTRERRERKLDPKAWMKTTRERRERKLVPETLILVYTGFPGVAS